MRAGLLAAPLTVLLLVTAVANCTTEFDPSLLQRPRDDAAAAADAANLGGCTDGTRALPGDTPEACGQGGAQCRACPLATPYCAVGRCVVERGVVALSATGTVTAVVDRVGALWTFGSNRTGQLGLGPVSGDRQLPGIRVPGGVRAVNVGGDFDGHGCFIGSDGGLACWGANFNNESGQATKGPVLSPTRLGDGNDWRSVSLGTAFGCGLRGAGSLSCWGWNGSGRLASTTAEYSPEPLPVGASIKWKSVSAGIDFACAIGADDAVYCWGSTEEGRLGGAASSPAPSPIASTVPFAAVSAGSAHACAIAMDGSLWCWGRGVEGQLGTSGGASTPTRVSADGAWASVSAGGQHTCALKSDRTLWCWGAGTVGQLGLDTVTGAPLPTRVGERNDWTLVAAGTKHTCGATDDGALYCWGDNREGEAGYATGEAEKRVPTRIALTP